MEEIGLWLAQDGGSDAGGGLKESQDRAGAWLDAALGGDREVGIGADERATGVDGQGGLGQLGVGGIPVEAGYYQLGLAVIVYERKASSQQRGPQAHLTHGQNA